MEKLKERLKEVNKQMSVLREERDDILDEMQLLSPFYVNEKVKVYDITSKPETNVFVGFGYVKDIKVSSTGQFKYTILKAKHDGTASKTAFSKLDNYKLEKI